KWAHVLWGCVADVFLIAAMLPLNNWIFDLIEKLGLARPSVEMPLQLAPMLLVACVLPAVTEEFVFRGTVGQSLRNGNKLASLAICGALFALFHLNAAQTVHQFVLGAFLALVMFRSGSVWTSVLLHFFNNVLAVALSFAFLDESVLTPYFVPMFCVGLAGFALCVFGYVKCTASSWEKTNSPQNGQTADTSSQNEQSKQFNVWSLVFAVVVCLVLWVANLVLKQ
ncbi:MAG: lysostaphin resistance A-like protein, partial [Candidatus Fimimonas sp.]